MRAGYAIVLLGCACASGCGGQDSPKVAEQPKVSLPAEDPDCGVDPAYSAHAAWSGAKPTLPPPPTLPTTPTTIGEAYTVYGAMRQLHLDPAPLGKEINIVGVVVQSNLDNPPKCAFHKTGKADPEGCITAVPSFRIADAQGDKFSIPVMGFASNFANVFEAAQAKEKGWTDMLWAVRIPYPFPKVGTKVKVTGRYAVTFTKSSMGMESDPRTGVLTYTSMVTIP